MFSTLITRIAGAASRRPKITIALWLVFVAGCVYAGAVTGTKSISGADDEVGQTKQAERALERAHLDDPDVESVLVRSSSAQTTRSAAGALARSLRATTGVVRVQPAAARAHGGRAQLLQATLRDGSDDAVNKRVEAVQREVAAVHKAHPGAQFLQTGDGSFGMAIDDMVGEDLGKAEILSLPLTLAILLLAFGAFVAAAVPLLLGITSVAAALGVAGPISQLVPANDSASSLVLLIGLAVGVDYSLFYIRREREERRRGFGPEAALRAASAGVARAIVMSGATVVVAIAGLLITGMPMFMSMALSTIAVVAIAVLGSLTVLPAMLAALGDRVDKGRVRRRERRSSGRAWPAIAGAVTRRPLAALIVAGAVLVALALPAAHMSTGTTTLEALPKGLAPAQAALQIEQAFGRQSEDGQIVVTGSHLGAQRAALAELGRKAARATGAHGTPSVAIAGNQRTARVDVPMPAGDQDAAVRTIRSDVLPDAKAFGAKAMLGGQSASDHDFTSRLNTMTPVVVAIVLGLAFVLLVAAFRSPWLAAGVIGLNLLSIGAAYGVLVTVFQYDWAEHLLGFTSTGHVVDWIPLFCFVILFGLSMDYTIIVLERIREARTAGHGARAAVAEGLSATAGAVTSAAVVMVAVFAVFAALRLPDMKQLGVGLSTAVLIDATIVRALALPAVVALLGERRWRVGSLTRDARNLRPSPARA